MVSREDPASAFESVAAGIDYPMFVVTTIARGERAGCLVGFATQVSLEPARFLACISRVNDTHRVAEAAEHLAVHVLGRDAMETARLFGEHSADDVDKFARCHWSTETHGLPILQDAVAWFGGPIRARTNMGDHTGLVIEPDCGQVHESPIKALMFADVVDFSPGH